MGVHYIFEELTTERLYLRKILLHDAKTLFNILKDKDVASTTLNLPYPCSLKDCQKLIRAYINELELKKTIRWAITKKEVNDIIGVIRLTLNFDFNSGELGFWMGKNYWRNGYTFEAAEKVIGFGFSKLNLNRIEAHAMAENNSSINLLNKLSFQREGLHPELVIKWGEYKDVITFGLLKKNY